MLQQDVNDASYNLLSIDPGTDTLGVCIAAIDLKTLRMSILYADTIKASRSITHHGQYDLSSETHGDRFARNQSHSHILETLLTSWNIHGVVCESPFMHIRPQAFQALVECIHTLKMTVWSYSRTVPFNLIAPMQAKKMIGVSKKDKNNKKDQVKLAMARLLEDSKVPVNYRAPQLFDQIDEHTADAIMIAYTYFMQNKNDIKRYCSYS